MSDIFDLSDKQLPRNAVILAGAKCENDGAT